MPTETTSCAAQAALRIMDTMNVNIGFLMTFPPANNNVSLTISKLGIMGRRVDRNRRLSEAHFVVGGRSVGCGHKLVGQAQVDAKLGAMMHQVIQEHLAVGQEALSFKDGLALKAELPVFYPR